MTWRATLPVLLSFLASLPTPALANLPPSGTLAPGGLCRPAILAAERSFAIPEHLLGAIAHVESGRRDPATGTFAPWPWTINAEGQGSFYDTKAEAIAAVQTMRARGMRSIDVGCMQISLLHHPDAFANLYQAFDPTANAAYGARFLRDLYGKSNAWPRAVEMYHSATPGLGEEYGRLVYAALPAEQRLAGPGLVQNLSTAWAATLSRPTSVSAAFPPSPLRIIPLAGSPTSGSLTTGAAPVGAPLAGAFGRGLDSYRSMPIRMA